jgi:hypothetical protein
MGIGIDGNGDNIQIHNNYIDDIGDGDLVHSNAYPDNFGLIYGCLVLMPIQLMLRLIIIIYIVSWIIITCL